MTIINCPYCGKEFEERDQRSYRNAGYTAHRNSCPRGPHPPRHANTVRRHTRAIHAAPRPILPAPASAPLGANYHRRQTAQRQRRRGYSERQEGSSPSQQSTPASSVPSSSAPSISPQQRGPPTFQDFTNTTATYTSVTSAMTTTSVPSPSILFTPSSSSSNFSSIHPYHNTQYQQPLASSSSSSSASYKDDIPSVTVSTTDSLGTTRTHPMNHYRGPPAEVQEYQPPQSLASSSSSPSLPTHQQTPGGMVNYFMFRHSQQQQEDDFTHRPFLPVYLSDNSWRDINNDNNDNTERSTTTVEPLQQQQQNEQQPFESIPFQQCTYCLRYGGVHDRNSWFLQYFASASSTCNNTQGPPGPSSSAP